MFYLLLTLLVIDALLLIGVVLLQSGKGGGLAAMGAAGAGSDTLFGSRQATTLLTKASWWLGGIFLTLALVLSSFSARVERPESILRGQLQQEAAPAPVGLPPLAPEGSPGQVNPAAGAPAAEVQP